MRESEAPGLFETYPDFSLTPAVENPPLDRPNRFPVEDQWLREPQQAQPFDSRRTLREKLQSTAVSLKLANQRILEQQKQIERATDSVAATARENFELRMQAETHAREVQQQIRVELVKHFGFSNPEAIDRQVKFVINGIVPPLRTSTDPAEKDAEQAEEVPTEVPTEVPEVRTPAGLVRADDLHDTVFGLRDAEQRLYRMRADSSIRNGRVRIQHIHDRVRALLQDLEEITGYTS